MSDRNGLGQRPRTFSRITRWLQTIALAAVLALLAAIGLPSAAHADSATLQLDKSASVSTVEPGDQVAYSLQFSCSSLTLGCVDATITDVLPAELDVTALPSSTNERLVTYDVGTRTMTIKFLIPLTNPNGQNGLPAGKSRTVQVGLRLPTETPVANNAVITNSATGSAVNATDVNDSVDITAEIPVVVRPVATKTWSPTTAIAQSGDTSTITLGARNASSSSADVRQLRVTDETAATFNAFDVTQLGPITAYPAGANRVVVGVCNKPIGSPCTDGQWIESAELSGNGPFSVPGGGAIGGLTGVRFTFVDVGGAKLPYSADAGTVAVGMQLRDNYRSTGLPIQPQTRLTITNSALPTAIVDGGGEKDGTDVKAPFNIEPDSITVKATKNMFADNVGNFTANGSIVVGQDSGITMTLNAKNTSAGPVKTIVIDEPSATATQEFDKIDLTKGRFTWPTGTKTAKLEVTCRSGADPAAVNYVKATSPVTVIIADFGCASGVAPASVRLTYTGTDGSGNGTIAAGAAGQLDLHGDAVGVDSQDVSDGGLVNCFDAHATTPQTSSSAGIACKTVTVSQPSTGIGGTIKSSAGVNTIVADQPMKFDLSFKNSGNVPVTGAYIVDPVDPGTSPSPFDVVQLKSITTSNTPTHVIEVWDPTPATGPARYVTYVSTDSALLARATGFRVRVTGSLPVGQTFRVSYYVTLRDGVPLETTFTNCAAVGIDPDEPEPPFCSPEVTVKPASAAASLEKVIAPGSVLRPEPGLPTQKTTVKHAIFNSGNAYFKTLQFTDIDPDFFDAVTFAGNMNLNFPPGANRARVDVCTTDCAGPTFINGTPTASATPGLPAGVAAADVQGIRVTFSNANNGYELIPGKYTPNSGACKSASFCFDVNAREYLRSAPQTLVPLGTLENTSNGLAVTNLPTAGTEIDIPDVSSPLDIVAGEAEIKFKKGPASRLGPNETAPFDLLLENTGTTAIVDPIIADPLPDYLALDQDPTGGTPGRPFILSYPALPSGYTPLPTASIDYNFTPGTDIDNPERGAKVTFGFPGWNLPPGGKVNIRIYVKLAGTYSVGDPITNTGGAHGSNGSFTCDASNAEATDDPSYGTGLYCLSSAAITPLAGNAVDAAKWSAGDPFLGFYNTVSGQVVTTSDPTCPQLTYDSTVYTRYPCAASVSPGGTIKNLIRITNTGSTDVISAVAVDGLPVLGDTGVLLSNDQRGTEWSERPTMLTEVTAVGANPGITTDYTDNAFPGSSFCTAQLQPAGTCPPNTFNAAFSTYNTGFRTTMDLSQTPLKQAEAISLVWTMKAPLMLDTTVSMPAAWNSFAQKPTFAGNVEGQATEPLKTGVIMRFGTVHISKTVIGLPPGISVSDFAMEYSCSYLGEEIDSGLVEVTDGSIVDLPLQPTGAECRIWETDTQGASSPNEGEENAAVVTVPDPNVATEGITVPIENTFQAGKLTVTKTISGGAENLALTPDGKIGGGTFPIDVTCEFPVGGTQLPDFPASFDLKAGESVELNVDTGYSIPAGAVCNVYEGDNLHATRTVMTADDYNPVEADNVDVEVLPYTPETDQVGSTVIIDNQYDAGSITLRKILSGPGAVIAKGPFTFRFQCDYHGQTMAPIDKTVTVAGLTVVVNPLPVGAVCDVEEIDAGDSATPVPNTVATGVVVPASGSETVTVTSNNAYPTKPVCPLTVNALPASGRVKKNGKTTVVTSAKTSSACHIVVTPKQSKSDIKVKCAPVKSGRGDVRYCSTTISRTGRVVVTTYGYPKVRVEVLIKAEPKASSKGYTTSRWSRTWKVG